MKRTFIIVMALGMVIAFAAPASAKKGGGGPAKPAGIGYTCQDLFDNGASGWTTPDFEDGTYSVTFTSTAGVCIDILASAGVWEITVSSSADSGITGLYMEIADSRPGDVCWSKEFDRKEVPNGDFTPYLDASTTDVCGTAYLDTSRNGHETDPYVFYAGTRTTRQSGEVTITVTPPAPPAP